MFYIHVCIYKCASKRSEVDILSLPYPKDLPKAYGYQESQTTLYARKKGVLSLLNQHTETLICITKSSYIYCIKSLYENNNMDNYL